MELKGYIFPKKAVFRYAFFPYGVLFGAFVALQLALQLATQQHFLHFFYTRQHPHFAPLWYHFPSVRQMIFNASFNGCPVLLPQGRQLLPDLPPFPSELPPFAAIFGGVPRTSITLLRARVY